MNVNEAKLLYGLGLQGSMGDNNNKKPSFFNQMEY